jgi:hypothetical protein
VNYRRTAFCFAVLWAKGLNAKDIHEEVDPVYGGKCLTRKPVHNWVNKFSQGRSEVAVDARPSAEMVETTVKRLLCWGSRRTGKAMGHVYQCWWRICREIVAFFPGSNIICFSLYIHLWSINWISLVLMCTGSVEKRALGKAGLSNSNFCHVNSGKRSFNTHNTGEGNRRRTVRGYDCRKE